MESVSRLHYQYFIYNRIDWSWRIKWLLGATYIICIYSTKRGGDGFGTSRNLIAVRNYQSCGYVL